MKTLDRCCCFRLRTAGLILGWLGVVGSILYIVMLGLSLANIEETTRQMSQQMHKELDESTVRGLIVFALLLTLVNFVTSALLLMGTSKERHNLLMPWLVCSAIGIICAIIYHFYTFILLIMVGADFAVFLLFIVIAAASLVLPVYFYWVIYSLYKEIEMKSQQPMQPTAPMNAYQPSYNKV